MNIRISFVAFGNKQKASVIHLSDMLRCGKIRLVHLDHTCYRPVSARPGKRWSKSNILLVVEQYGHRAARIANFLTGTDQPLNFSASFTKRGNQQTFVGKFNEYDVGVWQFLGMPLDFYLVDPTEHYTPRATISLMAL